MDTLRGNFGGLGASHDDDVYDDDAANDSPPPEIGADERRMQVRAYNFWASLLDNRNFPSVEDLDPATLPDFGPHGVLLDFSHGIEDPAVGFLGSRLAEECGAQGVDIARLSDVPSRSLLSRITDHYMQILANQAPIGFEAEFVNQRGATILYRGILLPFSSDDETIDFIFGVINWKELADQRTADELLLEIDQVLDTAPRRDDGQPLADWADGPGANASRSSHADLPAPSFGLMDEGSDDSLDRADNMPVPGFVGDHSLDLGGMELAEEDTFDLGPDAADMGLADWLAAARELALEARSSEDRTRAALYEAIGRAWDFALAAAEAPEEFAEMVEDAGLAVQERAPMTPLVKLVFGIDYDKTRLTEYATALTHARRMGLACGELAGYLRQAPGGLKGVVNEERRLRRAESGKAEGRHGHSPHDAIASKLRELAPVALDSIAPEGEEFALVMVRRCPDGGLEVLGEVPDDGGLLEKAARRLVG